MSEIKVENPKKKNTFRQTREKAEQFWESSTHYINHVIHFKL